MKKIKHTPTPWRTENDQFIAKGRGTIGQVYRYDGDNELEGYRDNATFIVKAVNCHDELLKVLKECQSYILKQKTFRIKNIDDFHIANVMTQAITTAEGN